MNQDWLDCSFVVLISSALMNVAIQPVRPSKKTQKLPARDPYKSQHFLHGQ